jgi:uncharacterized protein
MKEKITVTGANKLLFVFTMLFMAFQFILVFFTMFYGQDFIDNNFYNIILITQYGLILVPVLFYIMANSLDIKTVLRINKFEIKHAGLIVIMSVPAYFVAVMLNTVLIFFLQYIGEIPNQQIPVPQNTAELITGLLIIGLTPAICEEMLHRGVMLSAYEKRGSLKAVVITAVFFGLFHFDVSNFLGPVFLGLLIGYYVIRTNSIFAGVLAHFLNNTISELLQFFFRDIVKPERITVSVEEVLVTLLYGGLSIVFLFGFIKLFKHATNRTAVVKPAISSVNKDIRSVLSHWPVVIILFIYVFMTGMYFLTLIFSNMY